MEHMKAVRQLKTKTGSNTDTFHNRKYGYDRAKTASLKSQQQPTRKGKEKQNSTRDEVIRPGAGLN